MHRGYQGSVRTNLRASDGVLEVYYYGELPPEAREYLVEFGEVKYLDDAA